MMPNRILKAILRSSNNRGAALIFSYFVLTVILTLLAGFALSTVHELTDANRFRDGTAAFWLAEAGINKFLQNPAMLDGGPQTLIYGANDVVLSKDDTSPLVRYVTARGRVRNSVRQLVVEFPGNPPQVFNNTMSSGGNLVLNGLLAKLEVFGPTRLTGTYSKTGFLSTGWFEDKREGVDSGLTTFKYPDSDNNGTSDQFNDFVEFNRDLVSTYPPEEVVYIQSNDTQLIYPGSDLAGKKVVYVEGTTPGAGDVNIIFDAGWQDEQNLTVISTGNVDYLQPLQLSSDSQLNIVSWAGYNEAAVLYSSHKGVTYSHNTVDLYAIFDYSETTGNIVANNGINAYETLSWKRFYYGEPLTDGSLPPGFEGLIAVAPGGYSSTPSSWKEEQP